MAGAWSCCGRTGENCCRQSSSEQVNHISHWKCAKVITNTRKGAFWCSFLEYATWSISGSLFYCKYFFFIFCIFCNLRWSWSSLCFTSSTSNSNRQGHLHAVTFLLLLLLMIFFPLFLLHFYTQFDAFSLLEHFNFNFNLPNERETFKQVSGFNSFNREWSFFCTMSLSLYQLSF